MEDGSSYAIQIMSALSERALRLHRNEMGNYKQETVRSEANMKKNIKYSRLKVHVYKSSKMTTKSHTMHSPSQKYNVQNRLGML